MKVVFIVLSLLSISACKHSECEEDISQNCICNEKYDPVCGCNSKTYGNACMAECSNILSYTKGACK